MKTILILLSLTTSLSSIAKMPSSPYGMHAPNFHQLLPFTLEDLSHFKKIKIAEMEVYKDDQSKTIYYFDSTGVIINEKSFRNNTQISETNYKLNNLGLPISISLCENDGKYCLTDTISYDDLGKIIYYHSFEKITRKKNKIEVSSSWELSLNSSNDNFKILVDTSYSESKFYLNSKNEIILAKHENREDSIQIKKHNNKTIKTYWFKNQNDTVFKLGQIINLTENQIDTVTTFDEYSNGKRITSKIIYQYINNRLERTYRESDYREKTFHTYYNNGLLKDLPKEVVYLSKRRCEALRFKYKFRRF